MQTRTRLAVATALSAAAASLSPVPVLAAETSETTEVTHPVPAGEQCPQTDGRRIVDTPATFPRTVSLTFDDGPNPTWTPQVLAVLRRHGVHGTFFVVGKRAENNPAVLAEVVADGNLVGNHTWDHPTSGQGMYDLTEEQLAEELDRTQQLLRDSTDQPVCFFRAPQGKDASPEIHDAVTARGLTVANMHSAHDYLQTPEPDPAWVDLITERLVNQGDHPILLLHDGGGFRGNSVEALDRVITWYAERGYVFTDPAGRPFPGDPSVADSRAGYALEPTAQQRQAQMHRSAARAITELGEVTNDQLPVPVDSSTGTSTDDSSDPAWIPSAPVTPETEQPAVSGQRPALAGSAPL
jgi:peptidoglycan-N-acetylglucosamine deacetylase